MPPGSPSIVLTGPLPNSAQVVTVTPHRHLWRTRGPRARRRQSGVRARPGARRGPLDLARDEVAHLPGSDELRPPRVDVAGAETAEATIEHLNARGAKLGLLKVRLFRPFSAKDFVAALEFFDRIGTLAEEEGHHPDLHLVGYRNVTIEIWTHAIGGLSENDFILAAKIEQLPPPA